MANRSRLLTAAAVRTAGSALAACGQPDFVDVPPPAPTYTEQPNYQKPLPPEDFAPGKPGITQSPLPPPEPSYDPRGVNPPLDGPPPPRRPAGGPPAAAPFTLAPIPNPEDLTPEDRAKIYGPGERAERDLAGAPPPKPSTGKPGAAKPAGKAKPEQLGEALAGDVTSGAQFDTKALADGNEGVVTLNLPPSLLARLREEAGKLGLGPQARNAEARAKLSGEGYEITPNDTQSARLKEGEAAGFTWNVKPLDNASGTLSADVGVQLKGMGKAVDAHLAGLESKTKPDDEKGGGKVPLSPTIVGWVLAAVVAIIVFFAALGARNNRRKAERARRARAAASFGDYGGAEADKTTTTTTTEKPKS